MTQDRIEVQIVDGPDAIHSWRCNMTTMPDGSAGALLRGVAYKLQAGNVIDVAATAEQAVEELSGSLGRHAIISEEYATWILIQGMAEALAETERLIAACGLVVVRTGRWLGNDVDGVGFDWFLRCDQSLDPAVVSRALGSSRSGRLHEDAESRAARLELQHLELSARLLEAEAQVGRALKAEKDRISPTQAFEGHLEEAMALIGELQSEIADLRGRRPVAPPQAPRLIKEMETALSNLRPDVVLLRDTVSTAAIEFDSRINFYRSLHELPPDGSRPDGWKMIRGLDRWWERHVSTGRDDTGRAYARFDTVTRRWSLLLGWKAEQKRDIDWLSTLN